MKGLIVALIAVATTGMAVDTSTVISTIATHEADVKEASRQYVAAIGYRNDNTVLLTNGGLIIEVEGVWLIQQYARIHGGGKSIVVDGNELTVLRYLFKTKVK